MEDWDDEDVLEGDPRPVWKRPAAWAAAAAVVIVWVAIGYVVLNKNDDPQTTASTSASTTGAATTGVATTSTVTTTTAAAVNAPPPSTSVVAPSTTPSTTAATTTVPATTVPATTTSTTIGETPAATTAPQTDPSVAPAPVNTATYSTLPDGSPAPIIAVFNTDSVTLSGAVPSEETRTKLQALAIANSKFSVPVNNLLTIDPTVPIGIGVRVVELTSARFDPGSAKVNGPHALELDRVVSIMTALPNVTALVIGHADQIGSAATNYKLSADRAAAVVNYVAVNGIDPQRLSSRAVGDTDLLTLNDDAASLALNRRTELVFYGLLSS